MRTASVNDKITYAAEVQSMLRQLLTEVSFAELFCCKYTNAEDSRFLMRSHPHILWNLSSLLSLQSKSSL